AAGDPAVGPVPCPYKPGGAAGVLHGGTPYGAHPGLVAAGGVGTLCADAGRGQLVSGGAGGVPARHQPADGATNINADVPFAGVLPGVGPAATPAGLFSVEPAYYYYWAVTKCAAEQHPPQPGGPEPVHPGGGGGGGGGLPPVHENEKR